MALIGYLLCARFCIFCELPLKGGTEKKRGEGEQRRWGETGGEERLNDSNKKREKYYFT